MRWGEMGNWRLEQVKSRRLLPSCNHVATSGAAARNQLRNAACTISPEKGMSVPACSGRSFNKKAYSLAGLAAENGFSIDYIPSSLSEDYTIEPYILGTPLVAFIFDATNFKPIPVIGDRQLGSE